MLDKLQEVEDRMAPTVGWSTKLVEKPGTPLFRKLKVSFPMADGCARGKLCSLCDNKGNKCTVKRAVYQASCKWCKAGNIVGEPGPGGIYIGETSRQIGT